MHVCFGPLKVCMEINFFVNDENPIETKTWWGGLIRGLKHFGTLADKDPANAWRYLNQAQQTPDIFRNKMLVME